jgi:hypothetical protein
MKKKIIIRVCIPCGKRASDKCGTKIFSVSTFHMETCDVCGKFSVVTEPRDFGYPKFEEK